MAGLALTWNALGPAEGLGGIERIERIERAIAALEAQRGLIDDAALETALASLRAQHNELRARQAGEQRKLVTILFADLVDFTPLSQALDPEDVRSIVNRYFVRWHDVIEAHGGVVEKFIGDAVMAVFGLAQAHEDDPARAIRAALAMRQRLAALNVELRKERGVVLDMRVGIDTGDVVVSTLDDRPGQEFVVVGETVNRAARLQAAAPPGGVVISHDTHRHVRGLFGLEPLPGLRLKGIEEPVDAYTVLLERPRGFRLDTTRGVEGVDTSTVGRELELRRLQDLFHEVADERRWRVVTVTGEAGIGKTRLLGELDAWLAESPDPVWWFRGRAAPGAQQLPNALLHDMLAARLDIDDSDTPTTVRDKWVAGAGPLLGDADLGATKALVLAVWLGFEVGDNPALRAARQDPEGLSARASTYLAEYLQSLAARHPVVVLLEDLHGADDGSLDWIDYADAVLHDDRVLVVATARPSLFDRRPHWGEGQAHHARVDLTALSRRHSRQLLDDILQRADQVPEWLADLVIGSADGNPFYIEEFVTWLVEAGVITKQDDRTWRVREERIEAASVPPTLRGLLQARIDAVTAEERAVLQRASVIGRVFWDDAVDHLADPTPSEPSSETLGRLRSRQVVHQRERSTFADTREFLFKHALLRDVAYDSVLKARRRAFHGLAADWLARVADRSGRADEYAAIVADHFDQAGDHRAAGWYLRAGRQAAGVHANREAARLLGRGLQLADDADPSLRFDLLLAREAVHDRTADRDAQHADLAALDELIGGLDDPERRTRLLLRQSNWAFARSEYDDGERAAGEAVEVARHAGLAALEAEAQLWEGKNLTWSGRHDEAEAVLQTALDRARGVDDPRLVGETLRQLSMVAGNTSRYPEAEALLEEALAVFRADDDLEGEGLVLNQLTTVHFNEGRLDEARRCLEMALPLFRLTGHRYRQIITLNNLGAINVNQGYLGEGLRLTTEGLALVRELGDREGTVIAIGVLGDIHRIVGQWETSRRYYDEALAEAAAIDFAYLQSDISVGMALVALATGRPEEAVEHAAAGLERARTAGSPLGETRVHVGQGYALIAAGRLDEAAEALAEAVRIGTDIGVPHLATEARASLALVRQRLGDDAGALEQAEVVLPELTSMPLYEGALVPGEVPLATYRVLDASGDGRAGDVLQAARSFLDEFARRIDADELSTTFLENVPANAELGRLLASERL